MSSSGGSGYLYNSDGDFYGSDDDSTDYSSFDNIIYDYVRQNRASFIGGADAVLHIIDMSQGMYILKKFDDDRKLNKHCDVTIKICNGEIRAHRLVLTAASDYFEAMFSHNTKESQSGIVELVEMDSVSVKKCIDFIYTGKLTMNEDEWEDLLYVARMMLLTAVCEKIEIFLRKSLTLSSYFRIKKLASKFDLEELDNSCDEFGARNLDSLMETNEFGSLELDYILLLLSHVKFSAPENVKVSSLLKWVKFDVENRRQDFSRICEVVHVKNLSSLFCKRLVENEPLCYGCAKFMEAINGCKQEISTCINTIADMIVHDASLLRHPPDCDSPTNAIILFNTIYACLMSYQPSTRKWYKEFLLHKDMANAGHYTAVVVANYLYVLSPVGKFFRILFFNGEAEWEELETSPQVYTENICTAVCGEVIYVSGGYQMGCFNIADMRWEDFDKGPAESACSTLVECDDYIYSVGGGISPKLSSVYKYNPRSRSWCSVACMNMARGTPAATCFIQKIYVAGGYDDGLIASTECYSLDTDTWTLLSSMKTPRSYFKLVVADDKMFVIGYNDIEVYDPVTNEWDYHCKHPFPVGLQCSATVAVKTVSRARSSHTNHSRLGQRLHLKRLGPQNEDVTPNKRIYF